MESKDFLAKYKDSPVIYASKSHNNLIYDIGDFYLLVIVSKQLAKRFDKAAIPLKRIINAIERYGDFAVVNIDSFGITKWDKKGKVIFKPFTKILYAAYKNKPYSRIGKGRVYQSNKDPEDYTSANLFKSGDIVECTPARRVYQDGDRIYLKMKNHERRFFTEYEPELLRVLQNTRFQWCVVTVNCNKKLKYYTLKAIVMNKGKRAFDGAQFPLSWIVFAYHNCGLTSTNIMNPLRKMRKLCGSITGNSAKGRTVYCIDHIRDNRYNNCIHNLSLIKVGQNTQKCDHVTRIYLPYFFISVNAGSCINTICGKISVNDAEGWYNYYTTNTADDYNDLLTRFKQYAVNTGDMVSKPMATDRTLCLSQMLRDDGTDPAIQGLLLGGQAPVVHKKGDSLGFEEMVQTAMIQQ